MSIFPFIDPGTAAADSASLESLPMLKEYAYDFERNELLLDADGNTYLAEGNMALRIWIFKALTTKRFHHTAYSPAFGEEYEDQLTGCSMNGDVVHLEMKRFIVEALMVNPYIKRLENFLFAGTSDGLQVTFDCTSIYGKETIPIHMKEVRI